MKLSLRTRVIIAVFICLFCIFYLIPTVFGKLPSWWSKIFPSERIHLGLDLQGGMHLILEVEAALNILIDIQSDEGNGLLLEDITLGNLLDMCARMLGFSGYGGPIIEKLIFNGIKKHKHSFKLTLREIEVLQLICDGLSDKEIAAYFKISVNTVISRIIFTDN